MSLKNGKIIIPFSVEKTYDLLPLMCGRHKRTLVDPTSPPKSKRSVVILNKERRKGDKRQIKEQERQRNKTNIKDRQTRKTDKQE